nr:ribonuclease H-like domain-containing protein [Tanacetum cinerariifolium]
TAAGTRVKTVSESYYCQYKEVTTTQVKSLKSFEYEDSVCIHKPEDMDQDSAHMVAASKVLMLKPGEFEIWRMIIKQYIQMMDYALWKVIENGATLPKTHVVKVSQLELLGEKLSQEDVNQKLLRSLLPEWNTHAVLWRNKVDLDIISMDDLYNNLKVYELEVKGMSSSNSNTQNMAFLSSTNSSTNGAVNTAQAVNTANGVSTASTQVNATFYTNNNNLSNAVICAFLASQPNSSQLAHEDLEQIHPYDMEEIDLRWQMTMLTMRAKSDQTEEGPNYALMTYTSSSSDSKVSNDFTCSKSYLKTIKLLKSQNEKLLKDLDKSELMVLGYKAGLKSVEERLKFFKKNEVIYLEDIKVLKVEIQMKDIAIVDNCKKGLEYESYNAVSPPYIGNFMPPKPNLCYTGLDEFAVNPVVEKKSSEEETKAVRKNIDASVIEEWVSDDEEENVSQPKIKKKTKELILHAMCKIVLVVKPHNKTIYERFHGRTPALSFVRPFGCPVTVLNTKDHLGKFDGKADEGFFIGYSLNSKAFRVFNIKIRIMEKNLHIRFSKGTPNVIGTQSNGFEGTKASDNADPKSSQDDRFKPSSDDGKKVDEDLNIKLPFDQNMTALEDIGTFDFSNEDDDDDAVADMNNLDTTIQVSPSPTTIVHKDHPLD